MFRALGLAAVATFALVLPAAADDAPFLNTDPTAVAAKGEFDIQQWFNAGYGSTAQSFGSFEAQTEFDYGVTDRLQLALSLLYDWSRTRPQGGPADTDSLPGIAAEAIYVAMPAETSPIGLAFAFDPAVNANSRGFALRVLLEKHFGGWQHVLNVNFDNDWEKDDLGHWQGSSGIVFNYGLAYALDTHWTLAMEVGNELSFEHLLTDGHLGGHTDAIFIGPTIQYDCSLAAISLGVETQLPVASGSGVTDGYSADGERWRFALRFARAV